MKRVEIDKEIIDEIDEEENKEKRKAIIKKVLLITIPIILIAILLYVSLRYIGTYGIIVKEKAIYSNKINDDLNGIKIVHFSDIYYNEGTEESTINKLISKINNTNPDIVIFTGDLISNKYTLSHDEKEFLIEKLSNIKASINKIAIKGELDSKMFEEIMTNSNFELINDNEMTNIYIKNSYIRVANFNKYVNKVSIDDEIYNIVLTHDPRDIETILKSYNPDLLLSGHNLNGQVRIPLIGGLFDQSKYMDEYYKEGNTNIFITSGIGNKHHNIRWFNHPSINFIRLRKET